MLTDRVPPIAPAAWLGAVLLLAGSVSPHVVEAQAPRPGLDTLARFERYPLLVPDAQAHYLSSHDRTGGNDDGFDGTYSALYVDARGEHVIFDVKGPGSLYTLWFTSRESGFAPLGWGRIRFYFDDEPEPRLDIDADELFGAQRPPFVPPFVFDRFTSSGGHVSHLPFPFQQRLKITTENRVGFYNAYYHTYAPTRRVDSWTGDEDASRVVRIWNAPGQNPNSETEAEVLSGSVNLSAPAMPDGEMAPTVVEVFDWRGAGTVTALRFNPLAPLTRYQLNHLFLRISWDGEATPSVDVPLGSFFGSGLGEAAVRAVPLGMHPNGAYYCYLPMPFWERARVELVNTNPDPMPPIWWEVRLATGAEANYSQETSGYFKARYRREWPTTEGADYGILDTRGRGVYVGQVMTVEPIRPEVKRWWEGDLRIYVDGRRQPAFHGTGHEDEYLGGWSNEWLMNPYSLPMHGQPATRDLTQVDFQWSAATTVYRFFPGGVPYQSALRVSTEHGTENSAAAMYPSVAYYYEHPTPMRQVDALDVGDPRDEAAHDYRAVPATSVERSVAQFEGVDDAVDVAENGRAVTETSRYSLRAPDEGTTSSLRLRRLYDQAAIQEAEVWVNGARAGIWYSPATNASKRWAEADFIIPLDLLNGRPVVDIEIRVVTGPWSEYRYELWAIP